MRTFVLESRLDSLKTHLEIENDMILVPQISPCNPQRSLKTVTVETFVRLAIAMTFRISALRLTTVLLFLPFYRVRHPRDRTSLTLS
jgi:hypothetical protein